jgi:hypothetical protein
MATPYQNFINLLINGQPVDAPNTNVPISQLAGNIGALKEILDALAAGESLVVPGVTLDPSLPIGSPVYLGADGIFHLAQTALANDAAGGVRAASSFVKAILISLDSATTGTICLKGRVSGISTATWASIIDTATFAPGHYWLSATTPGVISQKTGPLAIYIGQLMADGTAFIDITAPDYGAHQHYHFVLSGNPAGTVVDPGTGSPQVVTSPDPTLPGWLPAASPYFSPSWIPAGAVFGYNINHPSAAALKAALPPIPNDGIFGAQGGIAIPGTTLVANNFGIWWTQNAYGKAPWPVNYNASPTALPIDFFFVQVQAATSDAIVTSLQPAAGNALPITFVDAAGNVATGGRLFLKCPSVLTSTSEVDDGATAVKSVTGGTMTSGPVVSHLIQGPGVTLTPSISDSTGAYGDILISAAAADALKGSASLVSLNNAQAQFVQNVPMATLPAGRNSTPVFSLDISPLAPATSAIQLNLWLFSTLNGNIPAGFAIAYRIVPAPSALTPLPTGWSSLGWSMTAIAVSQGQSQVVVAPVNIPSVPAGALVLIQVTRAGLSDGFTGDIGIIRLGYSLV